MYSSEPMRLSGHHLELIIWNTRDNFISLEREMKKDGGFDEVSTFNIIQFFRGFVKTPELGVRLTVGPDSVCDVCSNLVNGTCKKTPYDNEVDHEVNHEVDYVRIGRYGFEQGQPTTVSEILERTIKPYY